MASLQKVLLRVLALLAAVLLSPASSSAADWTGTRDPLDSEELPAEFIDPAAIDLTPLVNTLINSSQSGSRQLFSLLSVTSYSSVALHKLTLLVYNISSLKTLERDMFRRRFCYCVSNDTNDLTDFTAVLLDVMGNSSSHLHEIFKSASILSVSQRNNSECIYICVMAGRTGHLQQLWDVDSVSLLYNQTVIEGRPSGQRLNVSHMTWSGSSRVHSTVPVSSTTEEEPGPTPGTKTRTSTGQALMVQSLPASTDPSEPSTLHRQTSLPPGPTHRISLTRGPTGTSKTSPTHWTSPSAVLPPGSSLTDSLAKLNSPESTINPVPPDVSPAYQTPPPSSPTFLTPPQPAMTVTPGVGPVQSTTPVLPHGPESTEIKTLSFTGTRPPAVSRPGAGLVPLELPATVSEPATPSPGTEPTPLRLSHAAGREPTPRSTAPPAWMTTAAAGPTSAETSTLGLVRPQHLTRPVMEVLDTPVEAGCLWKNAGLSGATPDVVAGNLQPCVLELCRFFSQCLCRRGNTEAAKSRFCDDSNFWYEKHTLEVCRRVRRISISRTLKQRCLLKMCDKL